MIKYHPSDEWLQGHAAAELPLSLSIGIAAHCELCHECQTKLAEYTAQLAALSFADETDVPLSHRLSHGLKEHENSLAAQNHKHVLPVVNSDSDAETDVDMDAMLAKITANGRQQVRLTPTPEVSVKGHNYRLPKVFAQLTEHSWQGLGKISRMRLNAAEDVPARASLMHIDVEGEIPEHTHKGQELTLLLAGEFEDEFNQYVPGDFIVLNGEHLHSPKTKTGCLCYTIVDAPLHFTKGLSKLLNPIGELIY